MLLTNVYNHGRLQGGKTVIFPLEMGSQTKNI